VLLLDASTWVASAAAAERFHADAASLVRDRQEDLAALDLTLFEVANAIGVKKRQPGNAEKMARLIVHCCEGRRLVRVDPDLIGSAADIAVEHALTAYDAAYVAAARRNGWQLVSIDHRDLVSKGLAVTPDAALYP
jgi:predicted nucleic acid-binding protein